MHLLAVLTLLLAQAAAAPTPAALTAGTTPAAEPVHRASSRADLAESLGVLRQWDLLRAQAWAAADAHALRSLYVPRSAAGRADVRLLRAYTSRGAVVRRLVTQVFAVRVLRRGAASLRLSVFDRVAGGQLVRHGRATTLASSRPVTRTVQFRRLDGSWRVAWVSGSGRALR
jgi:hypothetical protein